MNEHLRNIQQSIKKYNKAELQQFCNGTVDLLGHYFKILEQEFPDIRNTKEIQKTLEIIFEEFLSRLPTEEVFEEFSPEKVFKVKEIAKECFKDFLVSIDYSVEDSYEVDGGKDNVFNISYKDLTPEECYPLYQDFLKRALTEQDIPRFLITFSIT